MGKLRPFVRKDSYMPNKKWIPFVIGNGYTTTDGASGPAPEYETVTGNPVSFNAITPFPLKQLQIAFSPVQDLHGYDAPWPAGGGKNKAELTDPELTVSATQRLATLDQTGTFNYVMSFDLVNATFVGSSASLLNFVANNSNNYRTPGQIRRISDGAYLNGITQPVTGRFYTVFASLVDPEYVNLYFMSGNYGKWTGQMRNVQVEVGTTPTDFTPYSNICPISGWDSLTVYHSGADTSDPQTISISLGETVYSGYVDVISGVGEVDKAYRLLNDAGKWGNSSGTTDYFYNEECADRKLFPSSYTGVICSYVQIRDQSGVAYGRWQAATGYRFGIRANGTGLTIDDVKAAATAGKIAICYELATPIPIQLTPQEVNSLAGDNTMWTDAASLEVTYRSN